MMSSSPGQMKSPPSELQSPPIENFLATVLPLRIRFQPGWLKYTEASDYRPAGRLFNCIL